LKNQIKPSSCADFLRFDVAHFLWHPLNSYYYSYDALCSRLVNEGVPDRFLGTTPVLDTEAKNDEEIVPRGLEIAAWLKSNNFNGSFCILDDRSDMEPHQDRLVQIDDNYGLIDRDIEKVISLIMKGQK
jgi:hypothetical protein